MHIYNNYEITVQNRFPRESKQAKHGSHLLLLDCPMTQGVNLQRPTTNPGKRVQPLGTARTPENFYSEQKTWVQPLAFASCVSSGESLDLSEAISVERYKGRQGLSHKVLALVRLPDSESATFPPHPLWASLLKLCSNYDSNHPRLSKTTV